MNLSPQARAVVDQVVKRLTREGRLVEGGWHSYRALVMSPLAGPTQVEECRLAFFAGAQHLFGSILGMLDAGEEPTEADLIRMDQIKHELDGFIAAFEAKHGLSSRTPFANPGDRV